MKEELSHINEKGEVVMVDVSHKDTTKRQATASGCVSFPEEVFRELTTSGFISKKGGIIQTAVIAGIQAVKQTHTLIPLCHQLLLDKVHIDIVPDTSALCITCTVGSTGRTGVEMEALTGVSVAALTVYDMCKALSHDITITEIQLERKQGGKKDFTR
ncbi:cyclic pyranopterin monophosphate synthase MoaC [Ascidiimonas aurantiaca]|uniref:cyclic pyranopterin monophosphate synthase MoaC n=1 Tax=Ascidiimonas aurantiaca TaxID=1685432 RepID=UPI0030ED33C9